MTRTCPNCGTSNEPDARFCKRCGRDFSGERVPNHLWKSVIATILFPITGIVAIFYAARVNSRLAEGDHAGAAEDSRLAKSWAMTTIGFVVALTLLFLVMSGLSAVV